MAKTDKISSTEVHADRILSYGEYRAFALLTMHKREGCWPHVDWKHVEDNLQGVTWESSTPKKTKKRKKS